MPKKVLSPLYIKRIAIGLGVLVLVGGGYFVYSLLTVPTKVRAAVSEAHPVYDEYRKNVRDIITHLNEDSENSDVDSLERDVEKAEGYVQSTKTFRDDLSAKVGAMRIRQLHSYRSDLERYIQNGDRLTAIEEDSAEIGKNALVLIKGMEEMATEIDAVMQYLFIDIYRYDEESAKMRTKIDELLKGLREADVVPELRAMVDSQIKLIEVEVELLTKIGEAGKKRSMAELEEVMKWYEDRQIELEKDINRAEDALDDLIREVENDSADIEDEVGREYNSLDSKYQI